MIVEILQGLNEWELLAVHNTYIEHVNARDDEIFDMDMFNDIFDGQTPEYIACRIFYGDFNPNSDYFRFDGYGNLESIYSYELCEHVPLDEIAQYCIDNDEDFRVGEIFEILESGDNEQ